MASPTKHGPFKDGYFEINGRDISDDVAEFTVAQGMVELVGHAHGDDVAIVDAGLKNWTVSGRCFQDFATDKTHQTLQPLYDGRTTFTFRCKPKNGVAVSATNPMWSGLGVLMQYDPLGGTHGDELMTPFSVRPKGSLACITSE